MGFGGKVIYFLEEFAFAENLNCHPLEGECQCE